MKLKITPLLILPIGLIIYGVYGGLFESGEEGWGTLFLMVFIGMGLVSIILYAISRMIFKTKVRTQIIVESAVIAGLMFYIYKRSGEKEILLPANYKDYVVIVYDVNKAKRLKKNILTNKLKIKVPSNGIVLTSSKFDEKYYPRASFIDEKLGPLDKILTDSIRRYEAPMRNDTVNIGNKKYSFEIWFIKWEKNYRMINEDHGKDSMKNVIRSILDK
jgi:hypothetical protein